MEKNRTIEIKSLEQIYNVAITKRLSILNEHIKKFQWQDFIKNNIYFMKYQRRVAVGELIKSMLDNYIKETEEPLFNECLKELAILINKKLFNGNKSEFMGIDLEFDKDNTHYMVYINTLPNFGKNSQIKKINSNLLSAKNKLKKNNSKQNIVAVIGILFGQTNKSNGKGDLIQISGQKFWEFISGDSDMYLKILKSIGYRAYILNDELSNLYHCTINKFTLEFSKEFCYPNGSIDWDKILILNSGEKNRKSID